MAKKTEKEKTELTKAYEAMGEAMENWVKAIGDRVKAEVESIIYKKEDEKPEAPSETDEGFTDESKWGTCTPAFILENGLAESEERAVEVAQFLKDHPEKKDFEFLKELFIKTQFKLPADRHLKEIHIIGIPPPISRKDDPIKVSQEEAKKAEEAPEVSQEPEAPASNEAPASQEEAPDVAHPAAQTIPVQQNPFGYNPMEQFLRGISMESQPMADQQPMVFTAPPQPQQTAPQRNIVNMNGILYEVALNQQGAPVLIPLASVEGIQQVNPTETQQVPPPHPAGFVVKEREKKEIVDTGMKVEGDLPGVDPSLIREEPVKVKITPMVETEETPAENPLLSIVKGGHPEISEEAGNTLLWDVLGTIKDSGFTCDFRELRDEAMAPVGIYEFHLFNGDQELTDLKFIVDLGKVFDKRAKFSIGASAGLEYKEWFELQKNVGKNLVYTDELLTKFFKNGRKWLFNQKAMYNRQWRDINKNFVDLSTIPEQPNKESRQTLNGIISDLYNCRELQAAISDIIPDPRFRVIEYTNGVLIMTNDDVKDNILGSYRKDPLIGICYGGDGKNVATVKSPSGEVQVTVPHNAGLTK